MRFREFLEAGWPALLDESCVAPIDRPLEWNFAITALVEHLQAVAEGKIPKFLANVPPGCLKSTLAAVLYPCWMWTLHPGMKFLFGTYSRGLTLRDAGFRLEVIRSEWYQEHFSNRFKITKDGVEYAKNDKGGYFYSTSTDATGTGWRADQVIVDDPQDPKGVESEVQRIATHRWLTRVLPGRINPHPLAARIMIQQRLDEQDATALALSFGGWVHLRIPCEYQGKNYVTPLYTDPRTEVGQAISETIYPKAKRDERKREMGDYGWESQFQQNPVPMEGAMVKRAWIHRYTREADGRISFPEKDGLTEAQTRMIGRYSVSLGGLWKFMTVDLAFREADFEDLTDPDYTVFAVWGLYAVMRPERPRPTPYLFLLDLRRERIDEGSADYEKIYCELAGRWQTRLAGFDALGMGSKIVRDLIRKGYPIRQIGKDEDALVYIDEDKYARVKGSTPFLADHRLFVPDVAPWLGEWMKEITSFPLVKHADQCDTLCFAIAIAESYVGSAVYDPAANEALKEYRMTDAGRTGDPDRARQPTDAYFGAKPHGL